MMYKSYSKMNYKEKLIHIFRMQFISYKNWYRHCERKLAVYQQKEGEKIMIKELTLHHQNGKKETYEVGREVAGETVKQIEVEQNRSFAKAIIIFESHQKVIIGIPFEYIDAVVESWV